MNKRIWILAGAAVCLGALMASAAPGNSAVKSKIPGRRVRSVPAKAAANRKLPVARKVPISTEAPETTAAPSRVMSPEDAQMAVAMLGDAYDFLLQEIHETYHTRPSVPVAATVIRKLHTRMAELGWPQARFLAVNAIVMHPDHVARDKFELDAIQALRRGEERVESVVDGQLRVATVVPLGGRCTSCHWSGGAGTSKAATTWNIPLRKESEK